jgi:peptide/nickel transport system substrate-binding protein
LAFLLASCGSQQGGGQGSGSASASAGAVLTETSNFEGTFTSGFNPFLTTLNTGDAWSLIYEPLLQFDYANNKEVPWLATDYKWDTTGKQLTLTVRSDVKWSDGQPFTASDVAYTFNLLKANAALNATGIPIVSATASNDTTVTLTFSQPAYQQLFEIGDVPQVPEHIWKDVKDPVTYTDDKPIGSGPFLLKTFTPGAITLEHNPNYWQGDPKVKTFRTIAYNGQDSALSAFLAGDVQYVDGANAVYQKMITAPKAGHFSLAVTPQTLVVNLTRHPLDQLPVRQAISVAIDRVATAAAGSVVYTSIQSPTGLYPPTMANDIDSAYKDLSYGKGDPAKAKQILEAAGYKMGSDGIFVSPQGQRLEFTVTAGSDQAVIAAAEQEMAQELKAAGIQLNLKSATFLAMTADVKSGNFDMNVQTPGQTSSAYKVYRFYMDYSQSAAIGKPAAADRGRFNDGMANKLIAQLRTSAIDSDAAKQAIAGLEKIMVEQLPVIPLWQSARSAAYSTASFTGWPPEASYPSIEQVVLGLSPAGGSK